MTTENSYIVYILECGDTTLYTGITTDLDRRMKQHRQGTGAKYTRGRGPFKLVWTEEQPDRSTALRREQAIKRLSREQKRKLIRATGTFSSNMDRVTLERDSTSRQSDKPDHSETRERK